MISLLQACYPGSRTIEILFNVVLGVTVLSSTAWLVAKLARRRPAARHLVLNSALLVCLALPVLVPSFDATGFRLISIPLLSEESTSLVPSPSRPITGNSAIAQPSTLVDQQALAARLFHQTEEEPIAGRTTSIPAPAIISRSVSSETKRSNPLEAWPPDLGSLPRLLATVSLLIWGLGGLMLAARALRSWRLVKRLRHTASPLHNADLQMLAEEAGQALSVSPFPRVLISRETMTPLAFGWLRPVVIVPDRLIGAVSDEEMRDIFLHEMAHLRRRDPLIVILQEIARALYWPIIPFHALILELGRAREELCDNHVLQGRDALSYGETLLHLAELSCEAPSLVGAVGILRWKGELEQRIAGLLDQGRSTMTRSNRGLVCLVAMLFIGGGIIASAIRLQADDQQEQARGEKSETNSVAHDPKNQKSSGRSILIHTLGPDGRPMPGVAVHRSVWTRKPSERGNRDATSDQNGEVRFDIPEGIYICRLWARVKGHVPLFAHWEEEDVPEKSLPSEFTFKLKPGTTIGGVVRDKEGQPIKGVMVEVQLNRGGRGEGRTTPDMWVASRSAVGTDLSAPITNAQGNWTLDNVPPGDELELLLKLSHPDYVSDANWGDLQNQQGVNLKALRDQSAAITMQGGIVAAGTVTDPEGKPISKAVVVRGDDPYTQDGNQEVLTDERGFYELPPQPSGKLTITAIAKGWMPAQTKAEIRQGMGPVNFELRPGKELKVRVVDQAGKPLSKAWVGIAKWRKGEALYNHKHPSVIDTQIPNHANGDGIYDWAWAPDDAVTYTIAKEGYVSHEATLVANGTEQTVTLPRILKITGKVTDTKGRPIKDLIAIPVIEFSSRFLLVDRIHARTWPDGAYAIEADRNDVAHRVRVEALGYRTAMSNVSVKVGVANPTFDFQLEPAPPLEGRVVDAKGQPLKDARVYLATNTQHLNGWPQEDDGSIANNQKVVTDATGRFRFPAQFELTSIVAVHDQGYAEVRLKPDEQPGDLALKAWASVEGRLVQNGQPIPSAWVGFQPIHVRNGILPHFQDQFSTKTNADGRFVFSRVPPVKSFVKAQISVWNDGPLKSSRSVPLDLKPGERAVVDLGGQGTLVKGRVVLSGDAATKIDLHKSLNWLLRRSPGIEPPLDIAAAGLTAKDGWNNAWTSTAEGQALIDTLQNHFVVLEPDGRFEISGVQAGEYDLAFRLYEPPGNGCLVSPVGSRIVKFQVSESAAKQSMLDLGEIRADVNIGPRVGDLAPDFKAVSSTGETVTLARHQGRFVLLDFWATWCGPCVEKLPALERFHATLGTDNKIAIVGLNLDEDKNKAKQFLADRKLPWSQVLLGGQSDELLSRYAIGQIPTLILIDPDGKLLYRGDNLEEITEIVRKAQR